MDKYKPEIVANSVANELIRKIQDKSARIGVIGLGYVGLPLAVDKAIAGYEVIGFDIQQRRVDMVNQGVNYIGDVVDEELRQAVSNGRLRATTDYDEIKNLDIVTICVPTPLDKNKQPDLTFIRNSAQEVAKRLHAGMLVVLESTTYPGTTEEEVKPILESTGLKCGTDFFLAFSPERVDPGNKLYNVKNTPKVVGGVTSVCTKVAATLYSNVLESDVFEVSSPKVAELEKLYENTFRNVNIALANELALICDRMGISVWEVIEAASTKPYGFMAFYPGPGLGGHCIPIDPFYLSWKAKEYDYYTKMIETSAVINDAMPEFVVDRIYRILNRFKKPLNGSTILILGVAYKKDIDDMRESPALKVISLLEKEGSHVIYNDPYIPTFTLAGKVYNSVPVTAELLSGVDLVVITTDHSSYDYDLIVERASYVFDTRNATREIEHDREKIELL
ncbi:nucleotide sugar dehydrogenase [Coprothermobacter proteolyticus]|uniref:nucleotide sugar dehydrogenase n=1 Tax=Coprothermobacter proteolyticus TaxID=35786 RepID=UPI000D31894C|nr:nucleotide sugar dehydrogenase [Coprothermobacter proteolyticus]